MYIYQNKMLLNKKFIKIQIIKNIKKTFYYKNKIYNIYQINS